MKGNSLAVVVCPKKKGMEHETLGLHACLDCDDFIEVDAKGYVHCQLMNSPTLAIVVCPWRRYDTCGISFCLEGCEEFRHFEAGCIHCKLM